MFIILNDLKIASKKLEELSQIEFLSEKNEDLKNTVVNSLSEGKDKEIISSDINENYKKIIEQIKENSNIQIITKNKSTDEILALLNELIQEYRNENNLRKIESLEQKLINNLDESSYSELIKLKSQLNRD